MNDHENQIGLVKWFNDAKGYGFIRMQQTLPDGTVKILVDDIFAHYTAIVGDGFKTLAENQEVEFDLLHHPKGPMAFNIRKVIGLAPILSGEGFSEFWKTCPELPWFKAMQRFHLEKFEAVK